MEFFFRKKSPQEFFVSSINTLHNLAQKKGFANKGFILHEGLIEIGNPFIAEGLKSEPNSKNRSFDFYYSLASSNLQIGLILAHYACVDKQSVISGDVFEKLSDVEASYKALLLVLKDNLNISFEEWDSFRHYIVPFWDELIKNYKKDPNIEIYNSKLLSAYYLLGVSIGLDKFEK